LILAQLFLLVTKMIDPESMQLFRTFVSTIPGNLVGDCEITATNEGFIKLFIEKKYVNTSHEHVIFFSDKITVNLDYVSSTAQGFFGVVNSFDDLFNMMKNHGMIEK
jgi:hypothetical protein